MSAENNQPSNSHNNEIPISISNSLGTMRELLGISTALTSAADASFGRRGPVDSQALKFFFDTIDKLNSSRGTYENDVLIVKQSLEKLRCSEDGEKDNDILCTALDNIIGVVDHIDIATDFMKLGGFSIVGQHLKSDHSEVIRRAAEVIGIATQNHPICQEAVLAERKIFLDLFAILRSAIHQDNVKLKAVFAVSSIIQNNKAGLDEFVKANGYEIFMNILKTGTIPLRLRTCFVIDCLCSQFPQIKSILLEKDYIGCLVDLITKIPLDESKETVLSAMLSLVEGCYDAIEECKKEEYNLIATLDYLIAHYKDNAEEEKQKALKLKGELDRFSKLTR